MNEEEHSQLSHSLQTYNEKYLSSLFLMSMDHTHRHAPQPE